jgi:uncharacterized membrane protein (DUF4010 family)
MDFLGSSPPEHLDAFVTSLGIGLLLGLERERRADSKAGLRTFALTALLGTLAALIGDRMQSAWPLAAGLAAVAAMMIAANFAVPNDDKDPGTTSVVALMLCFCLGAVVWFGHATLAVMLAIAATALLYFKAELHGFSHNLTRKDLLSILQFAVLTFVILPILPDRNFGPYAAFNPHQTWLMVVLIAGVSLSGYAALRFVGVRHGAAVIGFFGGLVSSTATTMVFSRHARDQADVARTASLVVLIASLMVMLRLGVLTLVVAPKLALTLLPVLGGGLLLGLAVTAWDWRSLGEHGELPMPEVGNPTELRSALGFGLLYAIVLLCAAWLKDIAGSKGLYMVALVSGLSDVDPIALSSLRLFNLDQLDAAQSVTAITLAMLANLAFKSGLVVAIGGTALARRALPGLAAIALGLALGLALLVN